MQRSDFYTYVHRRADTGAVFYVGKGQTNRAWRRDGRNPHWNRIVAKYGYSVEVVAEGLTEPEAHRQEKRLIKLYSRDVLANLTDGGDGCFGRAMSAEHKAKLLAANTGKVVSKDTRERLKAALTGRKLSAAHKRNVRLGMGGITPETRAKISAAGKGRKFSEEHKAKIRDALKGTPLTAERRANISAAKKANNAARRLRASTTE